MPVSDALFEAVKIVKLARVLSTTPNRFKIGASQNVDNVKVVTFRLKTSVTSDKNVELSLFESSQ